MYISYTYASIIYKTSKKEIELEDQDNEFSVTGDISDKLANPEETSKAKKKRKAQEKQVRMQTNQFRFSIFYRLT